MKPLIFTHSSKRNSHTLKIKFRDAGEKKIENCYIHVTYSMWINKNTPKVKKIQRMWCFQIQVVSCSGFIKQLKCCQFDELFTAFRWWICADYLHRAMHRVSFKKFFKYFVCYTFILFLDFREFIILM